MGGVLLGALRFSSHYARPKRIPTQTQADTAKASQRDALESFFGTFCSQKVQYPPVTKNGLPIVESKTSEAKSTKEQFSSDFSKNE
jgi:hypothetical protein